MVRIPRLVVVGTAAALILPLRRGARLENAPRARCVGHSFVSLACRFGALAGGRLIVFAAT